jgi:hypothetical protein
MNKAFVFDFDDTLVTTDCKVYVTRGDTRLKGLSPAEYNDHQLKEGEVYDYSEFRCDKKIVEACGTFLVGLAKEVHVYILTARSETSVKAIKQFLLSKDIKPKFVFCVGDTKGSVQEEKRKVLESLIQDYDKIYFYDDNKGNIDSCPDSPKIRKYQVRVN